MMELSKKEIDEIIRLYDLGKFKSIKLFNQGLVNYNYLLESNRGKFVLRRVALNRNIGDLKFELNYLSNLQKNLIYKIPFPLKTGNGQEIIRLGKYYFWIYNYIGGKFSKSWNEKKIKNVAVMIGEYHKTLEKLRLDNKKGKSDPLLRYQNLREIRKNINKGKKSLADKLYLSYSSNLIGLVYGLNSKKYLGLKQYPLHRDLGPENILFNNDKVSGILDFENVSLCNDVLVKDLAIVIQRTFVSGFGVNIKKAEQFVKEYRKRRKLSDKEIELIPDLIIASFIDDYNYSYWLFCNDKKRSKTRWIKENASAAKWFNNNKNLIIERLR